MIKLTAVLMLAGFFELSAKTYAQEVTIDRKEVALETVLEDIYDQTHYFYYADAALLNKARPVTIKVKRVDLNEALKQCFLNQPLTYEIGNKVIVIKERAAEKVDTLFVLRGRIVNEKGQPVAGASVQVKNSHKLAITNDQGLFDLADVDPQTTIIVTSVGYKNEEVKIEGRRAVQIRLTMSVNNLDQIQVIGYGTTTKRLTTGSVSKVTAEEIGRQPVNNPLAAISGRMAGVYIQQGTGVTNGSFSIKIRGTNSLRTSGNNPLYIVDGVPFTPTSLASPYNSVSTLQGNPLSNINPSDIQSIEILKDADATAIYGSRGANGVVLITTKKAKEGRTSAEINYYQGIGKAPQRLKLLNTSQYLEMRHEALKNDGVEPTLLTDSDLLLWDTSVYTNWQKKLIGGTANISNTQVSIGGGNRNTQFLVGGSFARESSVFPGDFLDKKGSAHINLNHTTDDQKFSLILTASYVSDDNDQIVQDLTSEIYLPPNAPAIYTSDGKLNWEQSTWSNPFAKINQTYRTKTETLVSNILLKYRILEQLSLKLNAGYTAMHMTEKSLFPLSSLNPAFGESSSSTIGTSAITTAVVEPQVEYETTMGGLGISALAGSTYQRDRRSSQSITGTGYSNDALIENIAAATTTQFQENTQTDYKYSGTFGRINVNWMKKLLLNATARRDGSSRFGPDKKYANFGAVGAAWILSEEAWMKSKPFAISFAKIRGSYGSAGNDQIADYGYYDLWRPTQSYAFGSAIVPANLFNADFAWERTKKLEAALDLGIFENRLFLSASFYRNISSNQLVGIPLPAITGFTVVQGNLPAVVRNHGWEFEIQSTNVSRANLVWTSSFNISFPKNKLLSYPNIAASSNANKYKVGEPLTTFKCFNVTGVDDQTGIFQIADQNKDGTISFPDDATSYKDISQRFFGGLENNISYKHFELSVFIQFVSQTARTYLSFFPAAGIFYGNQPRQVLDRWRAPGDQTTVPLFTQDYSSAGYTAYSNASEYGDNAVGDASFIRIKNISISYQISNSKSSLSKPGLKLFAQAQNPFTVTKYDGLDPETGSFTSLPPLKVFTAGIKIFL